jgi:hypothetical protein
MKDERENIKASMPDLNDPVESFPDDPAFDAWITSAATRLNTPNAPPRAEMWREIEGALQAGNDARAGKIPGVTPLRRAPWRLMSLVAAALLLGVALDRMVQRLGDRPAPPVAATPSQPDAGDPSRLYRMAAAQTLTQAEALLTAYRSGAATPQTAVGVAHVASWGRQVLGSTRLLIDSPAGGDPQLRALLEDLELVLVQIVRLSGPRPDSTDREHVDRALKDRDLLVRIRTAVPAGIAGAASSE